MRIYVCCWYVFVAICMIDKLTEIGRCYGMEMNVEKKQK